MTAQASHHPGMGHPGMAIRGLLAAALLAITSIATAADPVGRVISTTGTVTAVDADNESRAISRNDVVFPGETIRTAPRARAQIRFVDDALVALRPRTHFEIEAYAESDDDGGSAVMNLVQGALRAISGRIGNRADDEYRMNTPTATVGIRGTDYSLQYCDAECAGDGRREGTYGRVNDGAVEVSNAFGSLELDGGSYFFIPDDGPPEILLTPPDGVLDDVDDADGDGEPIDDAVDTAGADTGPVSLLDRDPTGGGLDTGAEEFRSGEETGEDSFTEIETEREPEPEPAETFAGLTSTAHAGRSGASVAADGDTYLAPDEAEVQTDEEGRFTRADMDIAPFAQFEVLNANNMEQAEFGVSEIGDTQVQWGRWEGSFRVDGTAYDGSVTWGLVDTADLTTPDQLGELIGLFEFGNHAGPLAVGNDGSTWAWDEFTMGLDFANAEGVFLNTLALSEQGGERTVAFSDATGEFTTETRFVLFTTEDGQSLLLTGGLFGEEADGLLTTAHIGADGIEITGTQILENLTDPDDAEVQEREVMGALGYGIAGSPVGSEFTFANRSLIDTGGDGDFDPVAVVDSAGRLIRVVQYPEGEVVTEFDGMTHVEGDEIAALEARWGRWTDGTITETFDGGTTSEIDGDYVYAYSENLATEGQLGELTGAFSFGNPQGPSAISNLGETWNVDALELDVDFGTANVDLALFELSRDTLTITFENQLSALDNSGQLDVSLSGQWDDPEVAAGFADGALEGRFIGETADGALVNFDIRRYDGFESTVVLETLVGVQVIENTGAIEPDLR